MCVCMEACVCLCVGGRERDQVCVSVYACVCAFTVCASVHVLLICFL